MFASSSDTLNVFWEYASSNYFHLFKFYFLAVTDVVRHLSFLCVSKFVMLVSFDALSILYRSFIYTLPIQSIRTKKSISAKMTT
jgi:hypothetical protein